jgi:ubiquinone/menaquinone biosynthesis C-methylase UbiE
MSRINISRTAQKAGKRYSSYAKQYKKLFHKDHLDDTYLHKFTELLPKNATVLDIGCGTGRDVQTLLREGFEVTGIDVSSEMIKIAKKENPDALLQIMEASNLQFPNNSFDGIISLYTLEHLNPKLFTKALKEIKRVLRNNGYFLLIQHDDEIDGEIPDLMLEGKKKLYRYMVPLPRLQQQLIDLGFKILYSDSKKFEDNSISESADKELIILAKKE